MSPVRLHTWYYTYLLQSEKTKTWYTGTTANLMKRVHDHNQGLVQSTRTLRPLKLMCFEACRDRNAAYRRERYLKSGMGKRYLRNRLNGSLTG